MACDAAKQHRGSEQFRVPEPVAAKAEGANIGLHVLEVQGRELEPASIDRAVAEINLQEHLPASVFADRPDGLSVQGRFSRNPLASGTLLHVYRTIKNHKFNLIRHVKHMVYVKIEY